MSYETSNGSQDVMPTPVTIVICTCDRKDALLLTLETVAALGVPHDLDPELVIVDNGSTDGTAEVVTSVWLPNMPVRCVTETRRGAGAARNAGLRASRGDIVLLTDDDVRLPSDWLEAMSRPILDGKVDAVAGRIDLAPGLHRPWMESTHLNLASTAGMNEDAPQDMFGASMGFARKVLDCVPGFDPELGPGTAVGGLEDTLFAWQLKAAGFRIGYVPVAVEHHPEEGNFSRASYLAAAGRFGRSRAYLAYHWQHVPYARISYIPSLPLTVAFRYARLLWWRTIRWRDCRRAEGIAKWEYGAVANLAAVRQTMRERRRPRNYHRLGLTKQTDPPRARATWPDERGIDNP